MPDPLTDDALSRLSIVLPVGPGDTAWPPLFDALRPIATTAELLPVFANGDPQCAPPEALRAPAGRAGQQNAGAAHATRKWLWFLHADSRLLPETLPLLRAFIARDQTALGGFALRIADDGPRATRWNARSANWRARWLGLPFGDQGLLLPRAAVARLGGFDEALTCGEDHALGWRCDPSVPRCSPAHASTLTTAGFARPCSTCT